MRIKVAIVNYLNTKPFIYGLMASPLKDKIELIECIPAECAALFHQGAVDLSLIPVGALNNVDVHPVSDYGIASDGPVASVCLLSEVPMHEIQSVYLDYQSRTSVILTQLLLQKYWKHNPLFLPGFAGYESLIHEKTAGLVIGDRALELKSKYHYAYDLGMAWKEYAGLPFVYAIWQQTKSLSPDFLFEFNQSLKYGVDHISNLIDSMPEVDRPHLNTYFTQNIQYNLNEPNKLGLKRFLLEVRESGIMKSMPVETAGIV